MLTERSEMETAAEAVRVTSSTRTPSPSSRGRSSLCVCSLLRPDRSIVHLGGDTHTQWRIAIGRGDKRVDRAGTGGGRGCPHPCVRVCVCVCV